jgi:uncharacterized protein (TIGR03067 family)
MTIKTTLTIASLVVLAVAPVLHAQKTAPIAHVANPSGALQGTWEGEEIGKESVGKYTMTIAGNSLRFDGPGKVEWYSATFSLSANQDPKQMVATITDCGKADFVGKSSLAIYKIENGELTLVGNRPGYPDAPKDFDGDRNSRRFTFKKAQVAK